jgi:two-component system sensor histidine kinase DesK
MRTQSQGELIDYSGGPWAYLLWLGFLLIPLQHAKREEWLATAGAIALFLALYFWGFHKSGPPLWATRLATFGLGISLFPYNAFAHTLFIYAAIPGAQAKTRESVVIMALTLIGSYTYFAWQQVDSLYFGLVLVLVLGLGASILVARANRASQQALAGKDLEIARLAKVAERERIARDIHDLLGHTLSLIAIKAELAYKLAAREQAQAAVEMREVAEVARKSLADVRGAIAGLRSIGLLEALKATDSLLRAAGLETTVHPAANLPALTDVQESALAQSLLEAGTNVVRHAQATQVSLSINHGDSKVSICVQDNGRGGQVVPGNGLNGMRERMRALNGSVSISALQPGLSVLAELPL